MVVGGKGVLGGHSGPGRGPRQEILVYLGTANVSGLTKAWRICRRGMTEAALVGLELGHGGSPMPSRGVWAALNCQQGALEVFELQMS